MTAYTKEDYKGEECLVIPDGYTEIRGGAFRYCNSLTSIVIPDSVTNIEEGAFWYCDSLVSVVIPDSVTSIEYDAFWYCKSLLYTNEPDLNYPNSHRLNKLKRYPKDLDYWSPELNPIYPCLNSFLVLSEHLPPELIFLVLSQNKTSI